jgi:hypothetical protein
MSTEAVGRGYELSPELNDNLRMELGWEDVGKGLTRVVMGYFVLLAGLVVGVGLLIAAFYQVGGRTPTGGTSPVTFWCFYAGLGILGSIGLFAYIVIFSGQLRCLIGAPERGGARWLMFFTMTCLLIGPTVNAGASVACVQRAPDFARGPDGFRRLQFTSTGRMLQLASTVGGSLCAVFFLLFLHALARCLQATLLGWSVLLHLLATLTLAGLSLYLNFDGRTLIVQRQHLIWLGAAWLVNIIWHVLLIGSVRVRIATCLSKVRAPLDV